MPFFPARSPRGCRISLAVVGVCLVAAAATQAGEPCGWFAPVNMVGDRTLLPQGLMSATPATPADYDAPYALSAGATRHRAANNNNLLPLDRLYYTYDYSNNALYDAETDLRQIDLRYSTFGLEKTLLDDLASVEVRLPYIYGYAAEQGANLDLPAVTDAELGNAYLGFKGVLHRDADQVLTAGLGVTLPTASDAMHLLGGAPFYTTKNHAIYLQPFVGYASRLSRRSFLQVWAQGDFAAAGNDLWVTSIIAGEYQEQDLLMLDLQTGYWLYEAPSDGLIDGIAGIAELHYTSTLNDTEVRTSSPRFSNPFNRMDVLNLTLGTQLKLNDRANARLAIAAPLRSDDTNRVHDVQFVLQFDLLGRR